MNSKKSPGDQLRRLYIDGWPEDRAGIDRLLAPLIADYGIPQIGSEVHPWPQPAPPPGKKYNLRWSFAFENGQKISITVTHDGRIVEREYTDSGNVHSADMRRFLRGLDKAITQSQNGGRRSDANLDHFFRRWTHAMPATRRSLEQEYLRGNGFGPDDLGQIVNFRQAMYYRKRRLRKRL